MRLADESHLIVLLRELIDKQDKVARAAMHGSSFDENITILTEKREEIYRKILSLVNSIVMNTEG